MSVARDNKADFDIKQPCLPRSIWKQKVPSTARGQLILSRHNEGQQGSSAVSGLLLRWDWKGAMGDSHQLHPSVEVWPLLDFCQQLSLAAGAGSGGAKRTTLLNSIKILAEILQLDRPFVYLTQENAFARPWVHGAPPSGERGEITKRSIVPEQ